MGPSSQRNTPLNHFLEQILELCSYPHRNEGGEPMMLRKDLAPGISSRGKRRLPLEDTQNQVLRRLEDYFGLKTHAFPGIKYDEWSFPMRITSEGEIIDGI